MIIKKLIIKNYGEIEDVEIMPKEIFNCVNETVGNAISIILNNQFAQKYFNTVPIRENTYLFGEIYHYRRRTGTSNKDIYTVTIDGFAPAVYTKNGVIMTDDEVDCDPVLTHPYREDNLCLFRRDKKEDFLDYIGFLPHYVRRSQEYSSSFKSCLSNRLFLINDIKNYYLTYTNDGITIHKRVRKKYILYEELGECDILSVRYGSFLLLNEMINYHKTFEKGEWAKVPLLVEGYLSYIDDDLYYNKYLLEKTKNVERQIFFVEDKPSQFEKITKIYY